jgi:hypothetical protein
MSKHRITKKPNNYIGNLKSYIDVNNYNNFLIELDKKQNELKENKEIYTKDKTSTNGKQKIDKTIKNISNYFIDSNLKVQNFTGLSPWESLLASVEKHIDPNLYQPNYCSLEEQKNLEITAISEKIQQPKQKVIISTEINNINEYCEIIRNCKKYICSFSGNHCLAASIRDNLTCFAPEMYYNMKYFIFDKNFIFLNKIYDSNHK